jgi:Tfp pilus assembly PilM family ATPase
LLGIDLNDQSMSLIELMNDHEGLEVISYEMEQLPLNVIINGGVKYPEIANNT